MQRNKGFSHWFRNVFCYHYGKLALALLAALAVVIWLTADAVQKKEDDLNAVVAIRGAIGREDLAALTALLADAAGDRNGDGELRINIQTLNLQTGDDLTRLQLYLSLPEYTVFLLEESISDKYCSREGELQPLEDYGLRADEPGGKRAFVGDKQALQAFGGSRLYVSLSDWTVDGEGDPEMTKTAVRAIQALLDSAESEERA